MTVGSGPFNTEKPRFGKTTTNKGGFWGVLRAGPVSRSPKCEEKKSQGFDSKGPCEIVDRKCLLLLERQSYGQGQFSGDEGMSF